MNDELHQAYKLLKKVKDPKFDIDRLHNYSLSLHLGPRDFQLFVTDTEPGRCMLLEDYVFNQECTTQQKLEILHHIFDDHHLLLVGFWKSVVFAWKNRKFSMVPAAIFSDRSISSYLRLNGPFDYEKDHIFTAYHPSGDFVNVFAGEKAIVDFIDQTYKNKPVQYLHQSSVLVEGAREFAGEDGPTVLLFIDRFSLHIGVLTGDSLMFYNQYPIKRFNDYIKYIQLVAKELDLDFNKLPIVVYGYMGQNTPHFEALKKSLGSIGLGRRPGGLKYGYVFDEILDHQYFDLLNIYLARCHT